MKKTRNIRKKKNIKISVLLLFLVIIAAFLLFTNAGKEIIYIFSQQESAQEMPNKSEPQVPQETQEPVPGLAAESVPQVPPQQEADTESEKANQQEQAKEKTAVLSEVIRAGRAEHAAKEIALTFDAGWLYENAKVLLNLLAEYHVEATFFARGNWVKDHPELATKIVKSGHALENHSLTHGHLSTMTDAEIKAEIHRTTDIIREVTGYQPKLFRPPYGEYDKRILRILREEGYPYTILWSVDSHDWAEELNGVKITKEYLIDRVLENASDNGIVLMHVGGYETVNALPEIIRGLRAAGYELVKVQDIL
jgi:peptidoglycan/xylan/chitin deacetylase (PgdA/CDA1 family)